MRMIQSWFVVAVVIAACALTASKPAYADTFEVFQLTTANANNLYGIDTAGVVVIQAPNPVPGPNDFVYQTWVLGVHLSDSFTPPNLSYDNGITCIPTVSAGISVNSIAKCNNGHEVFAGLYGPSQSHRGIFAGPDLSDLVINPFFNTGVLDGADLNGSGDFVWIDGGAEEIFEAIDLSSDVPEPGSIVLLGTGALVLLEGIRRRVSS